ncbi:MAG: hypothetical protein V4612_06040 [Pseudomonadota bacterium]
MKSKFIASILTALLIIAATKNAAACACGCGVFDVSTSALIPSGSGGLAFFEYDYINQNQNWHGTKSASADNNEDKKIQTQIMTAGLQYNFNRSWGLTLRIPYLDRQVEMQGSHDHDHHDEESALTTNSNRSIGDVRLTANYSGFFSDMSTGLTFGVKLPTGEYKYSGFDSRDMQIGTGSTDAIIGAYHLGKLSDNGALGYFVQGAWQKPIMIVKDYRPGDEFNAAIGTVYDFGKVGEFSKVAPLLQIIGSNRLKDHGANADLINSGYSRLMFAPGIELQTKNFKFYADIELPIYYNVRGNQLEAGQIFKFIVGYKF